MQRGILLCCWLGLAACSSETPDERAYTDTNDADSTQEAAVNPPAGRVTIDGETYGVNGDGFCRRIGSRSTEGPEGVLRIEIDTSDYATYRDSMYLGVTRGRDSGLLVIFNMGLDSWFGRFDSEGDPAEFDGRRSTFDGTMLSNLEEVPVTARVEIDCPIVEDLTTE